MERRRRQKRLTVPPMPQINLTPMIDTVLVLLIVFMMVTPMMHNYLHIDLPKNGQSGSSQQSAEKELSIAIDRDGIIRFNNEQIEQAQLPEKIGYALQQRSDKGVTVYADQELAYRIVKKILDDINTISEVAYVALAAEQGAGA